MFDNDESGTHILDDYPLYDDWLAQFKMDQRAVLGELMPFHFSYLPVWIEGNVYLKGAKAYKNEKHCLLADAPDLFIHLQEKDGYYSLDANLYEYIKDFRCDIINSDILGKAFEPEQRFENNDGSDIIFDRDFLSNPREDKILAGPFADEKAMSATLW